MLFFSKYSRLITFCISRRDATAYHYYLFVYEFCKRGNGALPNKADPVRLPQRFQHKKFRGRGSFASLFNVQKGEPPIRRALLAPWGESLIS